MKNLPRIFVDSKLSAGAESELTREQYHYLSHVMRTKKFLAFNGGAEYVAELIGGTRFVAGEKTEHADPSGDFVFCFAPVKKTGDVISAAVQMGAAVLQPVITERVDAHVNWERMGKIAIEAAEQSGRNSVPELLPPISFAQLDKKDIVFGNPRATNHGPRTTNRGPRKLFIGPEGGFSDAEVAALEKSGAVGISLGRTVLRAEVAAAAICTVWSLKCGVWS